jgi:hypothetical protein
MMRRVASFCFAALGLWGCGPMEIGSRYVHAWTVVPSQPNFLSVTQEEEPALAGTALNLPAGVLPPDVTEVTLEWGQLPFQGEYADAGPVLIWQPFTALQGTAQLTFRYDPQTPLASLALALFTDGGPVLLPGAPSGAGEGLAVISVDALTAYQPVSAPGMTDAGNVDGGSPDAGSDGGMPIDGGAPDAGIVCRTSNDCPNGENCVNGVCQ